MHPTLDRDSHTELKKVCDEFGLQIGPQANRALRYYMNQGEITLLRDTSKSHTSVWVDGDLYDEFQFYCREKNGLIRVNTSRAVRMYAGFLRKNLPAFLKDLSR